MTIHIELEADEERALREHARLSGRNVADYVLGIVHEHIKATDEALNFDQLLDHEAVASSARDADDSITLDQVRAGTSTIKDSMARVVIEDERAER
jgi:hypothetical protein